VYIVNLYEDCLPCISLLVAILSLADPQVADQKQMQVRVMDELYFDNATDEYFTQLECYPSQPLGNIPVDVYFLVSAFNPRKIAF
jgi:hypothetical protein